MVPDVSRTGRVNLPGVRALFLLAAILAVVYLPVFGGQILFFRDLAHYAYPLFWFVRSSLERGDLPFWNPEQALGFPVVGNTQYGLWYPFYWLLGIGWLPRTLTWIWFFHMLLGGVGALFLARRFGASWTGAVVGGVVWSLAGVTTSEWSAGMRLPAGAWLPWDGVGMIRLVDVILDRSNRPYARRIAGGVAAAAAPISMGLLQGEIFIAMMGVGFALSCAAAWCVTRPPGERPKSRDWGVIAACVVAALLLGGAGGAVTVLPASKMAAGSERASALTREAAEIYSFHPLRTVELVAPGAMGDPYMEYPGGPLVGEAAYNNRPLLFSEYMGAGAVALAVLALGRRRAGTAVLAVLAAFALVVAMGRHTPAHQALRTALPPLGLMRSPEKYLVIAVGALSVLASLGAERALRPDAAAIRRLGGFLAVLAVAWTLTPLVYPHELAPWVRRGLGHGLSAAAAVLAVAVMARYRPRWAGPLLLTCVSLDLALAAWPIQQFSDPSLARLQPQAAQAIRADAGLGPGRTAPSPRVYRAPRIDHSVARFIPAGSMSEGESRSIRTLVAGTLTTFGLATVPGYDPGIPATFTRLWPAGIVHDTDLLRLLAVSHTVRAIEDPAAPEPAENAGHLDALVDPLPGSRIYRVVGALPRSYVAGAATVADDERALSELPSRDVIEGKRVVLAPGPSAPELGTTELAGTCRITAFSNVHIDARCRAERAAIAVFVEQYEEGWQARVDGAPAPLFRANLVARAVPIPAGEHRVELSYSVVGLSAGAAVSALAFSFMLASLAAAAMASTQRDLSAPGKYAG